MDYRPWLANEDDDSLAWIEDAPDEIDEDTFRLFEGAPAKGWFPSGVVFDLEKDSGIKIADAIPNTLSLLILSQPLRDALLRELGPRAIEFLPVRLRNQKKKLVPGPYHVANVLDSVACMDARKSEFRMNPVLKDQVQTFMRLALDRRKIPEEKKLFRLEEQMRLVIVRDDLAAALSPAFSGMRFPKMEDYGAEYRPRA
jgi:hypothetical protein